MKIRGALVGLGVVLLVGGAIVGPGYYWYCTQFSGEPVGKYPLSRSGKAPPPGWDETKSPPRPYSPLALELHPGMNTVGFIWAGTASGVFTDRPYNHYRAALSLDDREVMVEEFSVSFSDRESRGIRTTWTSIGAIEVPRAGTYRFVLEDARHPRISFSHMHIEVRRNVVRPNIAVALGGSAAAMAGFLLVLVVLVWRGRATAPTPRPYSRLFPRRSTRGAIRWISSSRC